eukprot:6269009-Amphidinium_carterae.2
MEQRTIAILKQFTVYTTDVASAFFNTPIEQEVFVQPPKEYYHNRPHTHTLWSMAKALSTVSEHHQNNGKKA